MNIKKITVKLRKHSYSVMIGSGLLSNIDSFLPIMKRGDQAMVITNRTIAPLYLNKVQLILRTIGVKFDSIVLLDGEKFKNIKTLNLIFTKLVQKLHSRNTTLVALGGGVIGDLTGFAAASYQRGVRFIQVPTTLLSQVDSSIGGKTGVNHALGKNMIGAFYQPKLVIIDPDCLRTLPMREIISGLAEVIKYSIISSKTFFLWLEKNMNALLRLDKKLLEYCISFCCQLKSNIITLDEHENNLRTLLNLGHTYGHAIEVGMGYGNWLHGEAIAVGITMATKTSERLGKLTKENAKRIINLLKRTGLPITGPSEMSAHEYLFYMQHDKKISSGKLRLVLPLEIGKCKIYSGISQDIIMDAIKDCQNHISHSSNTN